MTAIPYFSRILILPLGSFEYHGTQLPPDTDSIIANAIASSLAERLEKDFSGQVMSLPALHYGLSSEHNGMPNTAFVSHITYYNFLTEVLTSLAAARDFITVVNGHGGNAYTLAALEADFNCTYKNRKVFVPRLYYPVPVRDLCNELFGNLDVHAGSVEASLIACYLQQPARQYTVPLSKRMRGSLRFFRMSELTPHGVIQQLPTVIADPQKGSMVHEAIVRELSESVLTLIAEMNSVLLAEESV